MFWLSQKTTETNWKKEIGLATAGTVLYSVYSVHTGSVSAIELDTWTHISGRQTPGLTQGSPHFYVYNKCGGWTPG
jgi:hypothetical protein